MHFTLTNIPNFDFTLYDLFINTYASGFSKAGEADFDSTLSVLHAATPNIKLYYPEPFIATPTFVHDDIWFVHIVIYQYWLWFIFIFIIVFFFLAFLVTVRWCNIRQRPVRETRGVSRSKCGDLITATVPVSWATSIIIHESTDAIELQDGFGSTELAIGIRAYQWGWEYYYPKDLQSTLKSNSSKFFGNSLAYSLNSSKDTSFINFKNNLLTSSINTHSTDSLFHKNLSLSSNATSRYLSDFNLGNSSLISKTANNLITSPKVLNFSNCNITRDLSFSGFLDRLDLFDVFDSSFNACNNQAEFLSSSSVRPSTLNVANIGDLLFRFEQRRVEDSIQLSSNYLVKPFASRNLNLSPDFSSSRVENITKHFLNLTNPLNPTRLELGLYKELGAFNYLTSSLASSNKIFNLQADQDFKRWSSAELLEDSLPTASSLVDFVSPQPTSNSFILYVPTSSLLLPSNFSLNSRSLLGVDMNNFLNLGRQLSFFSNKLIDLTFFSDASTILSGFTFKISFTNSWWDAVQIFAQNVPFSSGFKALDPSNNSFNSSRQPLFEGYDFLNFFRSMNTYQMAFWKVFKSTLEEERSSFFFKNYSNTDYLQPIVGSPTPVLFTQLSKTSASSHNFSLVPQRFSKLGPTKAPDLFSNFNVFTYNFPFSVSFESDIIRYSWFDWYSLRNTISTKAIDTSVFNLHGSKDINHTFSKAPHLATLNRLDNFFTKYLLARKLMMPSYTFSPFFVNKFFNINSFLFINSTSIGVNPTLLVLDFTNWIINDSGSHLNAISAALGFFNFTYHSSNNHDYPESRTLVSGSSDPFGNLTNILTKKNYLLDSMEAGNTSTQTKLDLVSSEIYPLLRSLANRGGLDFVSKYTPFKFSKSSTHIDNTSQTTPKNPYKSLRRGITNMIRIQADKAVAMPTDTRLQILAVSKDIIHSWSIPSAGVKIDCIPGYSSHRVVIFSLSGVYWGQCMEICGRFHHWMPIVVYFMRRDLFCLWCVHFIYRSPQYNLTLQTGEQIDNTNSSLVSAPWVSF